MDTLQDTPTNPKGVIPTLPQSKPMLIKKDEQNKGTVPEKRNIVMIRHGDTDLNEDGDKIRGWIDIPLNEHGEEEAEALGQKLKGLIDVIVASDLIRTRQTAKKVSEGTGAPIIAFSKALRPWHVGMFTGQRSDLVIPNLIQLIKRNPDEKVPGGESFNDFKNRCLSEISHIEQKYPDQRVGVVAHHRNERLYAAWKKAGGKPDFEIDLNEFAQKGIPPGDALIE